MSGHVLTALSALLLPGMLAQERRGHHRRERRGLPALLAQLIIAALAGAPRVGRDARSSLTKDVEIYNALPEHSTARDELLESIDERIRQIVGKNPAKRSAGEVVLAISILVIAGVAAWAMILFGGWWWALSPVVAFLLILGTFGLSQGLRRVPRDSKGKAIN